MPDDRLHGTVLIAPDSFKGTFTAREVADAIGAGLRAGGFAVDICPIADGGEGTLDVLLDGGERRQVIVSNPLMKQIDASFGVNGDVAIVETAAASGLGLIAPHDRDPIRASSYGTGELIAAAVDAGARTIYLGVGGSATTDGGSGAIEALTMRGGLDGARLIVLCDVETAFEDAASVFARQKGASQAQVNELTKRLDSQARACPKDPRGVPGTGAAGGLAGGLWATFGAQLVAGAGFVLDAVDFERRCRGASAVVTGEGKLDEQSSAGKAVSEVARRAQCLRVPCYAIVGTLALDVSASTRMGLAAVHTGRTLTEIEAAAMAVGEALLSD